jgi:hypothetical protein
VTCEKNSAFLPINLYCNSGGCWSTPIYRTVSFENPPKNVANILPAHGTYTASWSLREEGRCSHPRLADLVHCAG